MTEQKACLNTVSNGNAFCIIFYEETEGRVTTAISTGCLHKLLSTVDMIQRKENTLQYALPSVKKYALVPSCLT